MTIIIENPTLKAGVKLPKSPEQWEAANNYIKVQLPIDEVGSTSLNDTIENFNDIVYNYFKDNYGLVNVKNSVDVTLYEKYLDMSKSQLKKELRKLKDGDTQIDEIRYVSKLLRRKVSKSAKQDIATVDHDSEITNNFWSYCKRYLEFDEIKLPTFTKEACQEYFKKSFKCLNRAKCFLIPNWIPKFNPPTTEFDLSPPSYKEINKIIKRMKASGSPCPLDQISIICYKRCPYMRSYIHAILKEVWRQKYIPEVWRRAITVLIHKKDSTSDPANFRPITLEPVALKIFTSLLRNRIYIFLVNNKYIESNIQKGFIPGMSGTFEHIAHLTHVINQARTKQRSVTITLIDLKNAFGEVHHNLIDSVLEYHHLPVEIRSIVQSLYCDFFTAITTKSFTTQFIRVSKGVLQGDCLSPLLFNLIVNTFIQYVKTSDLSQLGYHITKHLLPRHWYQFADDAVAVTAMESDNQILLNIFNRWCTWCDMIIHTGKCHSFGIRKVRSTAKQVKPVLYLNNVYIKPIDIGESFLYLGRYFDFDMSDKEHKEILSDKFTKYMAKINDLPLHQKNKLKIYQRYVLPKISWHLTITDISITWIKQNLDNILSQYLRSWLTIPISGTLNIITLSQKQYGLSIITISSKTIQCRTTFRQCIKNSSNLDIRSIHSETSSGANIRYDSYTSTREAIKALRDDTTVEITKLTTQKLVISAIWDFADPPLNKFWHKMLEKLPRGIYSFVIRYLNNTLPNATNTFKWKISNTKTCLHCHSDQTLGHVIGGCKVALDEKRYNWRHDSIILSLASLIPRGVSTKVYADIPGFLSPSCITGEDFRPDIVIKHEDDLWLVELTVGFETNILKNYERKKRYDSLIADLKNTYRKVTYVNLSMGAIGVVGRDSNILDLLRYFKLSNADISYHVGKIMNICVRSTYYIFCRRNKDWLDPPLMEW